MSKKFGKIALTSALALSFACVPVFAGCNDAEKDELKTQNTTLTEENTTLTEANTTLTQEKAALTAENTSFKDTIQKLNVETFLAVLRNVNDLYAINEFANDDTMSAGIKEEFFGSDGGAWNANSKYATALLKKINKLDTEQVYKGVMTGSDVYCVYKFKYESGKYTISYGDVNNPGVEHLYKFEAVYSNGKYSSFKASMYTKTDSVKELMTITFTDLGNGKVKWEADEKDWDLTDGAEAPASAVQEAINSFATEYTQLSTAGASVAAAYTVTFTEADMAE